MKQKFDVTGMTCSACSAHVDKSVRKLDGVAEVNVNLLQNTMTVEYDESEVNDDQIIRAVIGGGSYVESSATVFSERNPQRGFLRADPDAPGSPGHVY